jgi:hypothetical protein
MKCVLVGQVGQCLDPTVLPLEPRTFAKSFIPRDVAAQLRLSERRPRIVAPRTVAFNLPVLSAPPDIVRVERIASLDHERQSVDI